MTTRVAVIGGGLAGITAALHCADAGRAVTLLEARPYLGGLTHSFRRGELNVDNGQHVFLRCCTSYQALLRRLGVADHVTVQQRLSIPVRSPRLGEQVWLRRNGLPAPLHLGDSVLRYRPMRLHERLRFAAAALALRSVDPADPACDAESFGHWLATHGQSRRAIATLWDLVGVATLNAPAESASLLLAATVFQLGLLTDATAADIGVSDVPLRRLHGDPARERLSEAGARVRLGAKVTGLRPTAGGWVVESNGTELGVTEVVLAVPPMAAQRLLPPGSVVLPQGWAPRLGSSPIVNVHVVFDRQVLDEPFLAAVDSPVQWVFDRTQPSGLRSGQYVAMSVSAADEYVDLPTRTVRARMLPALRELLPAARRAEVLDFFVTRERHATFRPAPGSAALRPRPVTEAEGLFLAGAWTDTGWPATMESAVRSGDAAALALLGETAASASEGVVV